MIVGEELADLVRGRVADRVGQVDRRGAGVDRRFDDPAEEIAIAARRILRRKLHIVGELPRAARRRRRSASRHCLARDAQLALEVQIRRGEERVDPRAARPARARAPPRRCPAAGSGRARRSPAAAPRAPPAASPSASAGEAIGKPASMMSTPSASSARAMRQLGRHVHRKAGRLLAVAQRGVEDDDRVVASWLMVAQL